MKIKNVAPVAGCLASCLLVAPHSFADGYFGSVSASTTHSDNGNKSPDAKVAEQQNQIAVNIGASYENYIGKFEADYGVSYREFSESTQSNKTTLDGHSSLHLGNSTQLAELLVEHSRQTLLGSADGVDITDNQEEREVISIDPSLNWHFSNVDRIFLKGNFSDISYLENELSNSTRSGATLGILRQVTPVDSFGLEIQSTRVKFENFPDSNYTVRSAMFNYRAHLRQLSYSVEFGKAQSETEDGQKYTSPSYAAMFAYKSGVNTFTFNVNREITDTSFGGGNKTVDVGTPSSDGNLDQATQMNRKRVDLQWTTIGLCNLCTLNVTLYQTDDEYLYINANAKEKGATINATYALSHAATIGMRLTRADRDFPQQSIGQSYKVNDISLEYSYRLGRNANIRVFAGDEKRTGDNASTSYREKIIGVGVGYSF